MKWQEQFLILFPKGKLPSGSGAWKEALHNFRKAMSLQEKRDKAEKAEKAKQKSNDASEGEFAP